MEDLPDEIVGEILSRVPKSVLFNTLLLSKRWYKLTLIHVTVISGDDNFKKCCLENDILSIKRTAYNVNIKHGLGYACQGGHRALAEYMIEKGANNWNWGLFSACQGGHRELVDFMIEKGANNWNYGLRGACQGRYRDLAAFMIEKGANHCSCGKSIENHLSPQDKRS